MSRENGPFAVVVDTDSTTAGLVERATGLRVVSSAGISDLSNMRDSEGRVRDAVALFVDVKDYESEDAFNFISTFRRLNPFRPVLVILDSTDEQALCTSLSSGADDVLVKPLSMRELNARLQARLADHAAKQATQSFCVGNVSFDNQHRLLSGPKGHQYLSSTEGNLLLCLLEAKGSIVYRDTLKRRCWGNLRVSDGALDRKIYEVRRAIEEIGGDAQIRTAYGVGFGLDLSEAP